ncbi:MAG TPA: hypothetical protein VGB82_03250 [Alphaproteobacteria bacterium]
MALRVDAAIAGEGKFSGIYTWGAEVETFSPCGSNKEYWVRASDAATNDLSKAHQRLTTRPYEGIYVDVVGFYAGPTSDEYGFEGQYEGLFDIEKVTVTRKSGPSDCK